MPMQVKKSYDVVTLLASTVTPAAAIDTAGDSVQLPQMARAFLFTLDVTAAKTDAGDTLDVTIQTKIDGTNWLDVVHFTQVVGNGGTLRHVEKIAAQPAFAGFLVSTALTAGNVRDLIGDTWRVAYVQVDADSDASFTFSVTACPM